MHPNPLTQPHTQVAPAGELLWLGLYHNETRLGLARGWGRCVSADAPSIFNWLSDPTDLYGAPVFCRVPCLALRVTLYQCALQAQACDNGPRCTCTCTPPCVVCACTTIFRDSPDPPRSPRASTASPGATECAMMHSNGEWDSVLCIDSLVAIPARCLCALANASATFADDLEALEARAEAEVHLPPTLTPAAPTNPISSYGFVLTRAPIGVSTYT